MCCDLRGSAEGLCFGLVRGSPPEGTCGPPCSGAAFGSLTLKPARPWPMQHQSTWTRAGPPSGIRKPTR
eukprot:2952437-Pyramimonas_sp.AAC.1